MKKTGLGSIFFTVLFALALSGCASLPIVYDETVPEDKLCTLQIPNFITITEFDEAPVKWTPPMSSLIDLKVRIPEGYHTMKVIFNEKTIEHYHDFEAGYIYMFRSTAINPDEAMIFVARKPGK
ncbi:MAG: hypothetical protein LBH44_06245 [Treponema sp.]|jgi:hypothetical protein|nr:hypothetical protein [Treponema sp.]